MLACHICKYEENNKKNKPVFELYPSWWAIKESNYRLWSSTFYTSKVAFSCMLHINLPKSTEQGTVQ